MAGTEKTAQPLITTQVGGADLGSEFWGTTQMCAQPYNDEELVIDRPALTRNVFGLGRALGHRVLEVIVEAGQIGNLLFSTAQYIDRLAPPLNHHHLPRFQLADICANRCASSFGFLGRIPGTQKWNCHAGHATDTYR